jgi:hypothetical protein
LRVEFQHLLWPAEKGAPLRRHLLDQALDLRRNLRLCMRGQRGRRAAVWMRCNVGGLRVTVVLCVMRALACCCGLSSIC